MIDEIDNKTLVPSLGVKSILDIGRTLEYLETQGVCVATYGPTRQFPAFFTSQSGFESACNVTGVDEAANLVNTTLALGLQNGKPILFSLSICWVVSFSILRLSQQVLLTPS